MQETYEIASAMRLANPQFESIVRCVNTIAHSTLALLKLPLLAAQLLLPVTPASI